MKINIFWFRRDLRLEDNTGLEKALGSGIEVIPLFIFDTNITDELPEDDPRVSFIYERLSLINTGLSKSGRYVLILKGDPVKVWQTLIDKYEIDTVYTNTDYEPYSTDRDSKIRGLLADRNIKFYGLKDQVIFHRDEILKSDNTPYTVFTPYKNRWLRKLNENSHQLEFRQAKYHGSFFKHNHPFPSIEDLGFRKSSVNVRPYDLDTISDYEKFRDFPAADKTSYLSPHLRFGTVSIRKLVKTALDTNPSFLSELIWREFFMQILFHYPEVVTKNFKSKYDDVLWRNDEKEFEIWCRGETGYPIVDAGMRQLNETGYMHNRVRMITAGFLCKHLLIDWRWGEAYFAEKLLDYELSSNNGNWQWAAGTGCDAAPYFRIFNPDTQQKRFDPKMEYIRKWVPDFEKSSYPKPVVDHNFARKRAIET